MLPEILIGYKYILLLVQRQCTVKKSERASQMNDLMLTDFTLETLLSSLHASLPFSAQLYWIQRSLLSTTIYVTEAISVEEFKAVVSFKALYQVASDDDFTLKTLISSLQA